MKMTNRSSSSSSSEFFDDKNDAEENEKIESNHYDGVERVEHSHHQKDKTHYALFTFLGTNGVAVSKKLPIDPKLYDTHCSYDQNLYDLMGIIAEDSGFWIDEDTLIPFHRLLSIKRVLNHPEKPQVKNSNVSSSTLEHKEEKTEKPKSKRVYSSKPKGYRPNRNPQ